MPFDERQFPTTRQETITVLARVEREPELRTALAAVPSSLFGDPALGIHFARLAVIPPDENLTGSAAWLALESNFDTTVPVSGGAGEDAARAAHLDALAAVIGGALGPLFEACAGFPPVRGALRTQDLAAYWKDHLVASTASYQGHSNRDLTRIFLEQRLRDVIMTYLEKADVGSPQDLFDRIRKHVRECARTDPRLAGLDIDAPAPALPDPDVRSEHLREGWAPWLKASKLKDAVPIVLRVPEAVLEWDRKDVVYDVRGHQEKWTPADRRSFSAIAATEDHGTQNALTHVVSLRRGHGRLEVLKHAHATVDRISKEHFQFIGQLGRIPSIHFAKWLLFESDQRLLFLSNYDKSWESYLGDFVDKAPEGLNLAWSCTEEYPRTHAFAFDGAKDEETFKAWSRACQVPTQIFYSAYGDLTIEIINNSTWIRHRLHQPADAGGLDAWFRRLT
ncbi:MAG TPA: hypothetical protein VH044_00550 [Polyangiaceae bacterium]|jgi:hypothetical protein|nr:hypothetical protein [Polyangiaceae bacterium]